MDEAPIWRPVFFFFETPIFPKKKYGLCAHDAPISFFFPAHDPYIPTPEGAGWLSFWCSLDSLEIKVIRQARKTVCITRHYSPSSTNRFLTLALSHTRCNSVSLTYSHSLTSINTRTHSYSVNRKDILSA